MFIQRKDDCEYDGHINKSGHQLLLVRDRGPRKPKLKNESERYPRVYVTHIRESVREDIAYPRSTPRDTVIAYP